MVILQGCGTDLVQEGVNGFTFDPYNIEEMVELMPKLSTLSPSQLASMANASCEIIQQFSPSTFAGNVYRAVALGVWQERCAASLEQLLLWGSLPR